jgi:hypothetical protein
LATGSLRSYGRKGEALNASKCEPRHKTSHLAALGR